jgi:hypothetical protein
MSNHQNCAVFEVLFDCLLDQQIGLQVDRTCRFCEFRSRKERC